MHAAAIISRFLTGCSSTGGFADGEDVVSNHHTVASHLIRTASSQQLFLKLINDLIQFADQAFLRRDLDRLEDVSRVLTNLPVDGARQIGLYYHALAIKRRGYLDEAQTLFEAVADNAPLAYRARAIQGIGANYHDKGHLSEALRFQLEALRSASDKNAHGLQTMLMARGEIAIVSSLVGNHKGALAHFEKLLPLVCQIAKRQPFYFYFYHNALAVELNEMGRLDEATAACRIALSSPFALAYPEWSETREEIAAKRTAATPSVVSVNRPPEAPPALEAETTLSQQVKSQRNPDRLSWFVFGWPLNHVSFQIPLAPIADVAIAGSLQCILDRMRICIRPRAPPLSLELH